MNTALLPSALPDEFPWGQTVGLLLDALQVKNLLQCLHEWGGALQVEVLYTGTQWGGISRLSPCLVRVRDCNDPVLLQFLSNTQGLWGYLLVSDGTWGELLAHMRWLTSFRPPQDEEMFLRISDPAVAHALFAAGHHPGVALFGPCQEVVVANAPRQGWTQFKRTGAKPVAEYGKPYTVNEAQWAALRAVPFNKSVSALYEHMQRFFPDYRADLTPLQRLEHVQQLSRTAIEKGFISEHEIWLYANLFGFLGDDALEQHPDIRELLSSRSELTPLQRVDRAATLAEQRSSQ